MTRKPRVVVVGGSLGGLTAALVLRDAGCDVTIFERSASALEGRGAGIVLHPATERYLVKNRLVRLEEISTAAVSLRYLAADGSVLHESPCGYRFTAWNRLYRSLLQKVQPQGYLFGRTLTGIELRPRSAVGTFADGAAEEGDVLICADGISSPSRALLLPEVRPAYAGYVGWRGTVPEGSLSSRAAAEVGESINYHLMPDGHILTYPIPGLDGSVLVGSRLINFVWYRNVEAGPCLQDVMTDRLGVPRDLSVPPGAVQEKYIEELRTEAGRLPAAVGEVVRSTPEPFIQAIVDIEVPAMVFGRACLVGDAAFVARPHAAAGTAKAAADAWALREALEGAGWDFATALAAWERRQLALGSALIDRVRRLGNASQFGGGWRPGDPELRFGLERPGDSEERGESASAPTGH
jgi:2,6-dihydroxypyridine 3-monooxygenase